MRIVHLKDLVTVGNIGVGLLISVLALSGSFQLACYMIILAFVFDHMDGKVAKWTGMTNRFGKELDNIADLISYSVAPAFVVYAYFSYHAPLFSSTVMNNITAFIMGMMPLSFGCIRFARNNTYDISYPGFWLGFPRPVSAFYIIALLGCHLSALPFYNILAVPAVILLSYANLSFYPFMAHYGRRFPTSLILILSLAVVIMIFSFAASIVTLEPWVLDALLFEMIVYTFFQFIYIEKGELSGKKEFVKEIEKKISQDMNRS